MWMSRGKHYAAVVHVDGNKLGALIGKAAASGRGRTTLANGAIVLTVREVDPPTS